MMRQKKQLNRIVGIWIMVILTFLSGCKDEDVVPIESVDKFIIYMRSTGDDSNSGLSFQDAVKSLDRVHEILLNENPVRDIEIHINQGTYFGQEVEWSFSNGHSITFTPIDFTSDRPVFDGQGKETWFKLRGEQGENTNLNFRYLKVRNYKLGIFLRGNRNDLVNGWNGNNSIYGMYFENIGNKFTINQNYAFAVIDLVNSRDNKIENNHFVNVENNTPEECSHLHAVYLAHYSSNNQILRNKFENICGDPIRVRDESNDNRILDNNFKKTGDRAFFSEWFCRPRPTDDPDNPRCTKPGGECPSVRNEFRNNYCDKNYNQERPNLFLLHGDENHCGQLQSPRLSTSGNVNN
ncbi:right-handed parallel beta-helix repeat-containing protein [Neolewinella lacunae]|uniref:Right handed beta helix domain-containing protein n=1 Tax=Neolewinella lacunae TaxID=1517758 RepID=A0A923T724_9BACT|nr:right-handed parallel beta-helix repeat-containing protein [Neolewinella lacunae]MBC6993176.1 hypothetical protein [Neolewinella lacunae]MDN3634303.1 right-handed parallel beta-helix repeat-containing protein [Neolewinella lacunae]